MKNTAAKTIHTLKAHVSLNVRNVVRSIEFYQKMLGIEPCKVRTEYAKFDVDNPPLNLTLNETSFSERGALSHMGIQVASTNDVLATRERWIEAGLATRDEMQIICGYALQDKSWVEDPDGNQWEVFVVHQDNLPIAYANCATETAKQDDAQASATCPTATKVIAETSSCGETTSVATDSPSCCGTMAALNTP